MPVSTSSPTISSPTSYICGQSLQGLEARRTALRLWCLVHGWICNARVRRIQLLVQDNDQAAFGHLHHQSGLHLRVPVS